MNEKILIFLAFCIVFLVGGLFNEVYPTFQVAFLTENTEPFKERFLSSLNGDAPELNSPSDWVKRSDLSVDEGKAVIEFKKSEIKNPKIISFANTNSMDPVIDESSNAIVIMPDSVDDIHIGDIISYKPNNLNLILVHRVIGILEDEQGKYFILKGDNNPEADPGKVRFEQVRNVIVGVVY